MTSLPRRQSLLLRIARIVLRTRGVKRALSSPGLAEIDRLRNVAAGPAQPRARVARAFEIERIDDGGLAVFRMAPRSGATRNTLVYLPGGGYINPMVAEHWDLIAALVTRTGATVYVPQYALAPAGTADTEIPRIARFLAKLATDIPDPARLWLAGDSAGGGLATAAAIHLRQIGGPALQHLVLFSPWLDVELANPAIRAFARRDPSLAVPGLRYAGKLWAGDRATSSPLVSPVHADLSLLPPTTLVIGTSDIFLPDSRKFAAMAREAGADIEFIEVNGGFHVFVGAPFIPESRATLDLIAAQLTG
ncbi:alpha/beta hydrolase fold domain-containing protein [Microbacterium sp.]|uniref:alpha/beta hydrolase fold domain-containing protein n=1 Tax=Microbacterium sp. TaxID=51671 RepID=UPI003F9BBCA1